MKLPLCYYFDIFGVGVRVWNKPSWWRLAYYRAGGKIVLDLGIISLYMGGDK